MDERCGMEMGMEGGKQQGKGIEEEFLHVGSEMVARSNV